MQTHGTGKLKGTRQGSFPVFHSFQLDYTKASGVSQKLCTLEASLFNPLLFRVVGVVNIANNSGTSATMSVGTSAAATDVINAVDAKAAANTNYASTPNYRIATADIDLYATPTYVGTAATAGNFVVIIEVMEVNVKDINNQGD